MKIGIICTPYLSEEVWKEELVSIDSSRPWLSNLPEQYLLKSRGKLFTTDDISIAFYLKHKLRGTGHQVNVMIPDKDITYQLLENDINFVLIFDMLEAFHTMPDSKFQLMKKVLKLHNVYPPYEYQHFFNHKNIYYETLRSKGINVLPFVYISQSDYENNPDIALERVMSMPKGDDDKIIGKPIYGQESIDFQEFHAPLYQDKVEQYIERLLKIYSGVIFQPYVEGLRSNSEYKIIFVGDQPVYGARVQDGEADIFKPEEEPEVMAFAKKAFDAIPKLVYKGHVSPRLLTRVDVGCCYPENQFFVAEIEFVPSLFMADIPRSSGIFIDALLGDQIERITTEVLKFQDQDTRKMSTHTYSSIAKGHNVIPYAHMLLAILLFLLAIMWLQRRGRKLGRSKLVKL